MHKQSQFPALKGVFSTVALLAGMNVVQAQEPSPAIQQKMITMQIQQRPVTNPHDPTDTRTVTVDCRKIGIAQDPKTGVGFPAPTGPFVAPFDVPPLRKALPNEDDFSAGTGMLIHIGSQIDGTNGFHQLCAYQATKVGRKASPEALSHLPNTDVACPVKAAMKICTGHAPEGYKEAQGGQWILEY